MTERELYTGAPGTTVAVWVRFKVEAGDVEIVAAVGDEDSKDYADAIRRDDAWHARVISAARSTL